MQQTLQPEVVVMHTNLFSRMLWQTISASKSVLSLQGSQLFATDKHAGLEASGLVWVFLPE